MIYAVFALLIGFIYGAASTASCVVGEKDKNTYDLLFLTPLSDKSLTIGKLIGSTAHAWFLLLLILPFILISGLAGHVDGIRLISFHLVLISGTLFFASLGLLISISVKKPSEATGGAVISVIIIIIMSSAFLDIKETRFLSALSPIPLMREIGEEFSRANYYRSLYINEASFFGLSTNGALFTILLYLYLTYWAIIAVARKIRNPAGIYLSKLQAIIFFLIFEMFMVGAIWKYSQLPLMDNVRYEYTFNAVLYAYTFTNIVLLFALIFGLTLSYDDYFAYVRANAEKRPYKLFHQRTPSHLLVLICLVIMIAGFIVAVRSFSLQQSLVLHLVVALETVAIFYLVMQLFKTLMKNYGAIVSFILLIIANGIPPLVIAVFDLPARYHLYLNPIAYLAQIDDYVFKSNTEYFTLPIILGVLLIGMSMLFIKRHYTIKEIVVRRMQK
ncbi:MAG: ABC transporter permease [Planctomycetes bacterium]|nr:ABC transporter permease [Planctomycetota bacterium]